MKVAPSLLSADFLNLGSDLQMLNANADIIHLDVMDGTFVPNISFGFSVLDAVSKVATITTDAHLMVVEPQRWFKRLAEDKMDMVSFHLEAVGDKAGEYLDQIKDLGMKAGLVVNPDIPVEGLYPYIGKADFFLIMSVFAGFGGQKFIPESLDKIAALRKEISARGLDTPIEVDGGVGPDNASAIAKAGADIVVAGSAVFKAPDPVKAIEAIRMA